ncbi:MAG: glycosyltransferase family 2 protein [Acidobacteria bacterium]|nr:glycosyltransferase family 2 protein [Acidobacteriota bacterium]
MNHEPVSEITPLILTYNESPNIGRTLQRLSWAKRIVVIDSYSTDETLEILKSFPQVDVYQRKFDTAANQDNYGLDQITTEWVLSLDADYYLTDEFIEEVKSLAPKESVNAYLVRFKYCVLGKVLRGSLYPPRKVLYRREKARYEDDGHTQRVRVEGQTGWLSSYILHDDRKSLSRWLSSQDRYTIQEVKKQLLTPREKLGLVDLIRRGKVLAPFVSLFYCLIIQRGILDGWAGWFYALQRVVAETLLAISLIEQDQCSPAVKVRIRNKQNEIEHAENT